MKTADAIREIQARIADRRTIEVDTDAMGVQIGFFNQEITVIVHTPRPGMDPRLEMRVSTQMVGDSIEAGYILGANGDDVPVIDLYHRVKRVGRVWLDDVEILGVGDWGDFRCRQTATSWPCHTRCGV